MVEARFRQAGSLESALDNGRLMLASDPAAAEEQAREILRRDATNGDALRLLGAALRRLDRRAEAEQAEIGAIEASAHNPVLVESARAIRDGRWSEAERRLRLYLDDRPEDAAALNMLAQVASEAGAFEAAEDLLQRALRLAPAFAAARLKLGDVLATLQRPREAAEAYEAVLRGKPDHVRARAALAAVLAKIGEYDRSAELYGSLLRDRADRPDLWMSYGHVLKTTGRLHESIEAYRRATAIDPAFGEAWWSLANLKAVRLGDEDVALLQTALGKSGLDDKARLHIHFTLGKALEDASRYAEAFDHYSKGNRIRRAMLDYSAEKLSREVDESIRLFTPAFFARREGWGDPSPDPIFILGMPRAGSTLIEQILSTHSRVEGTSELPYIPALARDLIAQDPKYSGFGYPEILLRLGRDEVRFLGQEYLRRAAVHRKTGKPFFTDKLPNNWRDIGFIRMILPNARIVDARRHPLACCFSNFKQHFAEGQAFTYALDDMGHYYRDYVRLLEHFDRTAPGLVHRVLHDRMVDHSEAEIRRLLDRLGLDFEPECLRFYQNDRAVRTPSAEQVRRPINREGIDQWKPFESRLDPLKAALGPALESWDALSANG